MVPGSFHPAVLLIQGFREGGKFTAFALDEGCIFLALRHAHADAFDDHVDHLEVAVCRQEAPIDLDCLCLAAGGDDL